MVMGHFVRERVPASKFKFLKITQDEILAFENAMKAVQPHAVISHRDFLVYQVVLNAATVLRECYFALTPQWYRGLPLNARRVAQSLDRMQKAGLLEVERRRGKSALVDVSNLEEYIKLRRRRS
jgi:hypothetical protein